MFGANAAFTSPISRATGSRLKVFLSWGAFSYACVRTAIHRPAQVCRSRALATVVDVVNPRHGLPPRIEPLLPSFDCSCRTNDEAKV